MKAVRAWLKRGQALIVSRIALHYRPGKFREILTIEKFGHFSLNAIIQFPGSAWEPNELKALSAEMWLD